MTAPESRQWRALEVICLHEAAHAVVAVAMGRAVHELRITIRRAGETGYCCQGSARAWVWPNDYDGFEDVIFAEIMISLAGKLIERGIPLGDAEWVDDSADRAQIEQWLTKLGYRNRDEVLAYLSTQTDAIARAQKSRIFAIVEALIRRVEQARKLREPLPYEFVLSGPAILEAAA